MDNKVQNKQGKWDKFYFGDKNEFKYTKAEKIICYILLTGALVGFITIPSKILSFLLTFIPFALISLFIKEFIAKRRAGVNK